MMKSVLGNLDSVERVILTPSSELKLAVHVKTSSKSAKGSRLGGDYVRSYDSNYYDNRSQSNNLIINTSDYLSFKYYKKTEDSFMSETVMLSYPNLPRLKAELDTFMSNIYEAFDNLLVDVDGNISVDYEVANNYAVLVDGLPQDKSLMFSPSIITDSSNNISFAVSIYVNAEEFLTTIPFEEGFVTLYQTISNLDLLTTSQLLINAAMMSEIFNSTGGGSEYKPSTTTTKPKPTPLGGGLPKRTTTPNATVVNQTTRKATAKPSKPKNLDMASLINKRQQEEKALQPTPEPEESVFNEPDTTESPLEGNTNPMFASLQNSAKKIENSLKDVDFSIDEDADVPFDK